MRAWVTSVSAVIILSVACSAGAYTPPAGSPLASNEHPRLWLTRANLPEIRAKLAGDFRSEYQAFVSDLDRRMSAAKSWSDWAYDVSNFAFVYQVGAVPGISYGSPLSAYGDRAKTMLLAAVADSAYGGLKNYGLAYDWVFDRMSVGERTAVVNFIKGISDGMAGSGGNPFNGNDILSRSEHILAGLAFWGDGIDNAAADAMVGKYATLIEGPAGVLGAGSFFSGTDGGWSMGFGYSWNTGNGLATPRIMEAWRTANGLSKAAVYTASSANVIRYYPQWVLYNILPPTGSCSSCTGGYNFPLYRTHYMNAAQTALGQSSDFHAILAALRLYKSVDPNVAGLVQWLIDNRTRALGSTGYDGQLHAVFSHFIAGEKGIASKSPSDLALPLTKRFTNSGWVVMRTGWGDPSDTVVTFLASPWSRAAGTYSNWNQGSFTIDRRGPLALNSGSAIHHDYSNRAWASNTMIFPDSGETAGSAGEFWDMGGQRFRLYPQLYNTTQMTTGSPFDIGGIKRFQAASDFDYVFADVTRAYNGPANNDGRNTQKVASFTRHFVYFHRASSRDSDRVVVFDRALTTDTRFEKRWLLHPSAPGGSISINGTSTTLRSGKTEYAGADLVTATNTAGASDGRLYLKMLLPARRKIVLIGGSGSEFENPYGANDTREMLSFDPQYQGTYRIEVIPADRNTYDTFLNVLEATDAGEAPTSTTLLTGSGLVAARVGQKIAAFSPTEGLIETGYITVDEAGTYGVLICDLSAGSSYTVGGRTMTASSAGTIYVDVSVAGGGSRLTVTKVGSAPPPAPPAPVSRVEILVVP